MSAQPAIDDITDQLSKADLSRTDSPHVPAVGMAEAKHAYHVTNIKVVWNEEEKPTNQPQFKCLEYHIANDKNFDGPLVGLPSVFFSTTLYKNALPSMTTYPTSGEAGASYWRICVPLKFFEKYKNIYHYPQTWDNQKHLIFTCDEEESREIEGVPDIEKCDINTSNKYLYRSNDKWYTNDYDYHDKYFTNFLVMHNFSLELLCPQNEECKEYDKETKICGKHCTWNTVKRFATGQGFTIKGNALAAELRHQWSTARRFSGVREACENRGISAKDACALINNMQIEKPN